MNICCRLYCNGFSLRHHRDNRYTSVHGPLIRVKRHELGEPGCLGAVACRKLDKEYKWNEKKRGREIDRQTYKQVEGVKRGSRS